VCLGGGTLATVTNTDKIFVHGTATSTEAAAFIVSRADGVLAPGKTSESDGFSEIETLIDNGGIPTELIVVGTAADDTLRVSDHGGVMIASDNDVDIRARDATRVQLQGERGNDELSGRGGFPASSPAPATTPVTLFGGEGNDTLIGGPLGDRLDGQFDDDQLFSNDNQRLDEVSGGSGIDAAAIDPGDFVSSDVEFINAIVGRLKLDRTTITTRAGRTARLTLGWKHPKGWKQLRSLELTANDAGTAVGSIRIDPAHGHIRSRGALHAAAGSTVTHHGKWVTAQLRLRPSKRLAGRTLRLSVQATDVHGHRQVEPLAGSLSVTK
jgi:hypothetical protein